MHHWTIETTLWVAIPALILLILILDIILLSCKKIIHIPTAWHQWQTDRRAHKAHAKTRLDTQKRAYLHDLRQLITQNMDPALTQWIHSLPKALHHDPDIMGAYARYLLTQHQDKQAEAILRRCLQQHIHEPLITLYGQISSHHARISFIESLLKTQSHSAALHLCLGRLNMSNQLWGQARTHVEKSISLNPTPEAYAALGQLFEILNDMSSACAMYRKGLLTPSPYS